MIRLALILVACPALAGDSVPDWAVWPDEPQYLVHVHELAAQDAAWWQARGLDRRGLLQAVFNGHQVPPAPIPLPVAGGLLAVALVMLAVVKGARRGR